MENFSCRCALNYFASDKQLASHAYVLSGSQERETNPYDRLRGRLTINFIDWGIKISFSRCKELPLYCSLANAATLFKVKEHAYLPEIKIKYLIIVN